MKYSVILKQLTGYPTSYNDMNEEKIRNGDKILFYYNIFDSNLDNKARDSGYGIIKYDRTLDLFYVKLLQSIVIGNKVYTTKDNIYLYDKDKISVKSTLITIQTKKDIEIVEHEIDDQFKICKNIYNSEYEDDFYLYLKKLIEDKIIYLPAKSKNDEVSNTLREMLEDNNKDKNKVKILGTL